MRKGVSASLAAYLLSIVRDRRDAQYRAHLATRHGAKAHKQFDRARTPDQRVPALGVLDQERRQELDELYRGLNTLQLLGQIDQELEPLWQPEAAYPASELAARIRAEGEVRDHRQQRRILRQRSVMVTATSDASRHQSSVVRQARLRLRQPLCDTLYRAPELSFF